MDGRDEMIQGGGVLDHNGTTLATSYALSQAIKKIGMPDLVIGGRQAIDGDTAQVGPLHALTTDL